MSKNELRGPREQYFTISCGLAFETMIELYGVFPLVQEVMSVRYFGGIWRDGSKIIEHGAQNGADFGPCYRKIVRLATILVSRRFETGNQPIPSFDMGIRWITM